MRSPAEEAFSNPTVTNALGLFSLYIFDTAIPSAIPDGVVIEKKNTMIAFFMNLYSAWNINQQMMLRLTKGGTKIDCLGTNI